MILNLDLARKLAALTEPQPKACWANSIHAMLAYRLENDLDTGDAVYVEGWLLIADGTLAIEHGWLEIGGRTVDVTLLDQQAGDYHPVFRYGYEEVMAWLNKSLDLPYYLHDRERWREFQRAWLALPCNKGFEEFFGKATTERTLSL